MNRVLRRPMFRIGGSAGTGITSGLDRKGYKDGTDEYDRALKTTERFMTDITNTTRQHISNSSNSSQRTFSNFSGSTIS